MSHDGQLLIGALLDRMGRTEAQALLARLDRWLAATAYPKTKRFDCDQIHAIEGPYDRRREDGNGFNTRYSNAASSTPKDRQS